MDGVIDIPRLTSDLKKYDVTLASQSPYTANGSPRGDATSAQEQAPVIATRMKEAGVTTVILFTDVAMTQALMENATRQEWYPEWLFTGTVYQDLALLARAYPVEQSAHAFGLSIVSPWVLPDPTPAPPQKSLTVSTNPLNWYWGETVGTSAAAVPGHLTWLLTGIQAAGPNLTPKTFQQGLFSIPASGGAAPGVPDRKPHRLREDRRPAVRRVPHVGARLRTGVVGPRDVRPVARHRERGQGCGVVRGRRQALQGQHRPEEAVRLVRQVDIGVQVRHAADTRAEVRR